MPEQPQVNITENTELASAEFKPTADQLAAINSSCIANALAGLGGLSNAQKSQLRTEVASLQANLSTAIDLVKNKRARMSQQKDRLKKEREEIGVSKSNFSKFYVLAAKAVTNCEDAARAAQDAKSGVDMVFSRETEIEYRETLLTSLDAKLTGSLEEFNSSMDVLDKMILAIS